MSFFKVGPTELRILLAIGNLVALSKPTAHLFGQEFLLFDVGGVIGAIGLAFTLVLSAISNTRKLYQLEPLRHGYDRCDGYDGSKERTVAPQLQ